MLVKTFCYRNNILILSATLSILSSCLHTNPSKSENSEAQAQSLSSSKKTDMAESGINSVPVWERAPGSFANIENPKTIQIGTLNQDKGATPVGPVLDLQCAKDAWFKGVELYTALKQVNAHPNLNLVLLHFQNGMIIPIPRTPSTKSMTKVWIATAWLDATGKEIPGGFPRTARPGIAQGDRVALIFKGNRLIANGPGHPFVPAEQTKGFSPWAHADSLAGIITRQWRLEMQESTAGVCQLNPICHPKKLMEFGIIWSVSPKPVSSPMLHKSYLPTNRSKK